MGPTRTWPVPRAPGMEAWLCSAFFSRGLRFLPFLMSLSLTRRTRACMAAPRTSAVLSLAWAVVLRVKIAWPQMAACMCNMQVRSELRLCM